MSSAEIPSPIPASEEVEAYAAAAQAQYEAQQAGSFSAARSALRGVVNFLRGPYPDGVPMMLSDHAPNHTRAAERFPVFDDPRG